MTHKLYFDVTNTKFISKMIQWTNMNKTVSIRCYFNHHQNALQKDMTQFSIFQTSPLLGLPSASHCVLFNLIHGLKSLIYSMVWNLIIFIGGFTLKKARNHNKPNVGWQVFNWLTDFNGMSTHQGLFYALRLVNPIHCMYTFSFFV